mgnify:CR=1 FL=1
MQPTAQADHRTEYLIARVTPREKLQALRIARKTGHKGSISALLRDLLARAEQQTEKTTSTEGN